MGFQEAVRSGFARWNDTSGRSSRPEYWWWVLFSILLGFAWIFVVALLSPFGRTAVGLAGLVFLAGGIVLIVPTLTLSIRRLHDTNRSGFWLFISLIPYLGGLILFVFYILDGTPGQNRYGDRPGGNLSDYPGVMPFSPSTRVPPGGMASWPTADPAGPVTNLDGGLHLAVIHRVDDWAQVRASNGWVGWVDARRLVPLAPPPDPAVAPPPAVTPDPAG